VNKFKKPTPCDICGKVLYNKFVMKRHKLRAHGGEKDKKFACDICGKRFHTQTEKRVHQEIHSSELNYKCCECEEAFSSFQKLYKHFKKEHEGKILLKILN